MRIFGIGKKKQGESRQTRSMAVVLPKRICEKQLSWNEGDDLVFTIKNGDLILSACNKTKKKL